MKNRSKKSIIIGLSVLLLVTLTLIGLTYAYYRTRVIGNPNNESISVNSDLLELTYADGTADLSTEGLIEPGFSAVKSFSVENTGNKTVKYSIVLENVDNDYVRMDDWTYTLKKSGEVVTSGVVPNSDGVIYNFVSIDKDVIDNYSLEILYNESKEDQSIDMGKSLSFKVNIIDATTASVVDQPLSGTLLASIRRDNNTNALKLVNDSYYYVGAPVNNYVNFNEMCWKVVNINKDGSVKIILEDKDNLCEESNGNWDVDNVTYDHYYWFNTFIEEETECYEEDDYCYDVEVSYTENYIEATSNYCSEDGCPFSDAIDEFNSTLPDSYNAFLLTKVEAENAIEYLINDYQVSNKLSFWLDNVTKLDARDYCEDNGGYSFYCSAEDLAGIVSYDKEVSDVGVSSSNALRPAVILKKDVNVQLDGIGTESNPYVIKAN